MLMPTIEEMVARMRAGKGNAANSASFYTNLNDPAFQKNDFDAAWVVGWWKSRNDDKYYWVVNALSPRCKLGHVFDDLKLDYTNRV